MIVVLERPPSSEMVPQHGQRDPEVTAPPWPVYKLTDDMTIVMASEGIPSANEVAMQVKPPY